jgi:hypothetical protein
MEILFPQVECEMPTGAPRLYPKGIAHPKAVAAQTYKSKSVSVPFFESKAWAEYPDIFKIQFAPEYNKIPHVVVAKEDKGDWISYPYALVDAPVEEGSCVVWIEPALPPRTEDVRHVRLYSDIRTAERDNQRIVDTLRMKDLK